MLSYFPEFSFSLSGRQKRAVDRRKTVNRAKKKTLFRVICWTLGIYLSFLMSFKCKQCFFSPRKKKFSTRKFSRICPRKFAIAREKILKTAREKKIVPVKKLAKLHPRKKNLWARKKSKIPPEKIPKVPEKKSIYI